MKQKILTKDISCQCKYKLDEKNFNSDQWRNNNKCWCECKRYHIYEKIIFGILLHVVAKMGNIK